VLFLDMDRDKDGEVNLEELAAGLKSINVELLEDQVTNHLINHTRAVARCVRPSQQ